MDPWDVDPRAEELLENSELYRQLYERQLVGV